MPKTATIIRPVDQGRRMSLEEFDQAEVQGGYLYELGRGIIQVVDVPKRRHLVQINAAERQFHLYWAIHPERIHAIAGGAECKILVAGMESERHPDLAIYAAPPAADSDDWAAWIPELVIEVVSPGSEHRDYVEKREEYLLCGVGEYWIMDADRQEMLVLRRSRGRWISKVVRSGEVYSSRLFPGLKFDCSLVFQAAAGTGQ